MDFQKDLEHIFSLQEIKTKSEEELSSHKDKIKDFKNIIRKINKKYMEIENTIKLKHCICNTCYDCIISSLSFSDWKITKLYDFYATINLTSDDDDGDFLNWNIDVPFDETNMESLIKKFTAECESKYQKQCNEQEENDKQKKYQTYLKLKSEFEKDK